MGGTDDRRQTENAKVEAGLNLRFAESGTKRGRKGGRYGREKKSSDNTKPAY